jgi:hypothetical protein
MKWSKAKQRMASKLQEIERARKRAAELRLLDARDQSAAAEQLRLEAQAELGEAEQHWHAHLISGRLDLELGKAFAVRVLSEQHGLDVKSESACEAERKVEETHQDWQKVEAAVRSGDLILGRGRRALLKRSENASDQALSDATTWKWFRQ